MPVWPTASRAEADPPATVRLAQTGGGPTKKDKDVVRDPLGQPPLDAGKQDPPGGNHGPGQAKKVSRVVPIAWASLAPSST